MRLKISLVLFLASVCALSPTYSLAKNTSYEAIRIKLDMLSGQEGHGGNGAVVNIAELFKAFYDHLVDLENENNQDYLDCLKEFNLDRGTWLKSLDLKLKNSLEIMPLDLVFYEDPNTNGIDNEHEKFMFDVGEKKEDDSDDTLYSVKDRNISFKGPSALETIHQRGLGIIGAISYTNLILVSMPWWDCPTRTPEQQVGLAVHELIQSAGILEGQTYAWTVRLTTDFKEKLIKSQLLTQVDDALSVSPLDSETIFSAAERAKIEWNQALKGGTSTLTTADIDGAIVKAAEERLEKIRALNNSLQDLTSSSETRKGALVELVQELAKENIGQMRVEYDK